MIEILTNQDASKDDVKRAIEKAESIAAQDVYHFLKFFAKRTDWFDIFELLLSRERFDLQQGPKLDEVVTDANEQLIHVVIRLGSYQQVTKFFDTCLACNAKGIWTAADAQGETALHCLVDWEHPVQRQKLMSKVLNKVNAAVTLTNRQKQTPIEKALSASIPALQILTASNHLQENLLALNANGAFGPLSHILSLLDPDNTEHLQLMTQADSAGQTVLHKLVLFNDIETNELIKRFRALLLPCCYIADNMGATPIHLIMDHDNVFCLDIFTETDKHDQALIDFERPCFAGGPNQDNPLFVLLKKLESSSPNIERITKMLELIGRTGVALFNYEHPQHRTYRHNGKPSDYLNTLDSTQPQPKVKDVFLRAERGDIAKQYQHKTRERSPSIPNIHISADDIQKAYLSSTSTTPRGIKRALEKVQHDIGTLSDSVERLTAIVQQQQSSSMSDHTAHIQGLTSELSGKLDDIKRLLSQNHSALAGEHGALPKLLSSLEQLNTQLGLSPVAEASLSNSTSHQTLQDSLLQLVDVLSAMDKQSSRLAAIESTQQAMLEEMRAWRQERAENQRLQEELAKAKEALARASTLEHSSDTPAHASAPEHPSGDTPSPASLVSLHSSVLATGGDGTPITDESDDLAKQRTFDQ